MVDDETGEIVIRVGDLAEAARRHTGGSLKHGWLDAILEDIGWSRVQVQGYAKPGRAGRREAPHSGGGFYRGNL
jgi:hypothetical protein